MILHLRLLHSILALGIGDSIKVANLSPSKSLISSHTKFGFEPLEANLSVVPPSHIQADRREMFSPLPPPYHTAKALINSFADLSREDNCRNFRLVRSIRFRPNCFNFDLSYQSSNFLGLSNDANESVLVVKMLSRLARSEDVQKLKPMKVFLLSGEHARE